MSRSPFIEEIGLAQTRRWLQGVAFLLTLFFLAGMIKAAELEQAQKLFLTGEYEDCIDLCEKELEERFPREDWWSWLAKSQLELGRYSAALHTVSNALPRYRRSLGLRLLAHEIYQQNGETALAKRIVEELNVLGSSQRWLNTNPADLVALGRTALLLGADARLVLENFLNQAKKVDPKHRDAYLAIGNLSLEKGDYDLAAKTFLEGIDHFPKDPELFYGLARSYLPSDRSQMMEDVNKALAENPRHVPSLLLLVDHMIDAEEEAQAAKTLDQVLEVNPSHPEAWAYRAVLAHLRNDPAAEENARSKALQIWKTNPRVDFLIGQKISQKYRFVEGSLYQRRSLQGDSNYLPAKIQLAQDLLRLGEEEEGWSLAQEVYQRDGYDVVAYNLVTLRETLAGFDELKAPDFKVRMLPREASIYGARVMNLLERARNVLVPKYGVELEKATIVEIFPEQKDFAVRTFGMPGGEGYLGVCFGCLITANSPASMASRSINWEAVLWHEFCHVVTLAMTKNKMPRWLSEGISVYEERQANPAWGQSMTPRYREMILGGELTPVSELSGAFLTPKSGLHLQFAYYQSSLVVEFLVQKFGMDALKRILVDLGKGHSINETIQRHTAAMTKIEKEFESFARQQAEQLAPGLDFTKPGSDDPVKLALPGLHDKESAPNPKNFYWLTQHAKRLMSENKWQEAKEPLQTLLKHYPRFTGADNAYEMLAAVHRALAEDELELAVLSALAEQSAEAVDAYLRLMHLAAEREDWTTVAANADRYLAVNPLVPPPYRYQARALEELNQNSSAIQSYQKLLQLGPADPANVHFRLARLLHRQGDAGAKRHVLQALEEAPRFREAHRLLLELAGRAPETSASAGAAPPPSPAPPVPAKQGSSNPQELELRAP